MRGEKVVTGVYTYLDDAMRAIDVAKSKNLDFKTYSPTYVHEFDEYANDKRSNARFFTGIGAITGLISGFTLAIMCALDYPMRVSAKDLVAPPAYIVIGYECTILFGGLCTLLSILVLCGVPNIFKKPGYDPRFSDDKFGVVIACDPKSVDEISDAVRATGADEVLVNDTL